MVSFFLSFVVKESGEEANPIMVRCRWRESASGFVDPIVAPQKSWQFSYNTINTSHRITSLHITAHFWLLQR
jgi:hypothetical protein